MKFRLSLAFAMALSGSLGAFNGDYHYNGNGSSVIYRKDICSTDIFNANTISYDNYTTYELKSGDNYDLLPADILYAPAFLYSIDKEHCGDNQAARKWFDTYDVDKMKFMERREVVNETMQKDKYGLSLEIDGQRFDKIYKQKITLGASSEWQKYFDPKIKSKFGIDIFKAVYIKNDQDKLPLELSVSDGLAPDKQIPLPDVSAKKAAPIVLDLSGNEVKIINQIAKRDSVDEFNENIHQITIPSGYTGVIDTFFVPYLSTRAATYFITQDLEVNKKQIEAYIKNPNDSYKDYFRKKNGGNDYFSPVNDTRYDVSTLGLLNPILFENAIYKDKDGAYKGDVYTMHGDFLNRFVTGFGPDGNWEFDNTSEASYRYDGGWMSHRYLEDKSFYNKDGLAYSFGISYDKYDPITTYIDMPNEKMIYASYTGNPNIVYKQYAVDNYDDLKIAPLSLHVRPLYAYAKKDGDSYIKSDELMKLYGSGNVRYDFVARFYPDPKQVLSLNPIDLGISNIEMAYNSDVKVNADYSDFKMDTWYNGPNEGKPSNSIYGNEYTVNGQTKICGWWKTAWDGAPIFVCDGKWDLSTSSQSKTKRYDEYHAIKVEYSDLINGVDIFKLALDNQTSIPARKLPNNHQLNGIGYQKLKVSASLENIYYGNDIQSGSGYTYGDGAYTYNHKSKNSEYYVGFQWGSSNPADEVGRCPHCPKGTRYDVGLKGQVTEKQRSVMNDLALINFDLEIRVGHDANGKDIYVGHIKLTKEGKQALSNIQVKTGNQDSMFIIRIHNLYDESTGRVIPFDEPFKIKASGELPYDAKANIASDVGGNEAATHTNGNYIVYDQVAGLMIKRQDSANQQKFNSNDSGDGGHFLIAKDINNYDQEVFLKIVLQKQTSAGTWEDLGDVILKEYCNYKEKNGFCKFGRSERAGRYGKMIEYNLDEVFGKDKGYGALATSLLTNYNYLSPNQNYPFTLQQVYNWEPSSTHKTYGVVYKEGAEAKANEAGVFRFKVANLSKLEIKKFFVENNLSYKDGVYAVNGVPNYNPEDAVRWSNKFKAFANQDKYIAYTSTFISRPAFSRLSKIGESHISELSDSHKKIYSYHKALKANDTKNHNLEFDFYSGKVDGDEIEMNKKLNTNLLSSLNKRVDRFAFLFHQYNSAGDDRHYILNQGTGYFFTNDNALTSPVTFPYVGRDVGILALVRFENPTKYPFETCRQGEKDDEENKAKNGKYGCYPEPILGKVNFEPHEKNILCGIKNQFAFFRDRESDETKEKELKFDESSLYNVLYQCTQKYVDEKGNPLYSIDEDQCININNCLSGVKSDSFDYEISGSLTKDNAKDKGLHIWLKDINDDTKPVYQNLYDLAGDYVADKNVIADKFYERIYANLAPTLKEGNRIYWLDSVWEFFNQGRTPKTSYYEATVNENANATNGSDIVDVGNTFMLSVSKDRTEALPPVYFKELISNDNFDTCEGIATDCVPKNIGKAQGVLKYGILDVEDIVLTKAPSTTVTILDKSNSNDPKFNIKVYDDNGFIDINEDERFLNAKKSTGYSELKNQIVADTDVDFGKPTTDGYYIDDTSVVDLAYDVGADIGYKIKTKNPINNSFVDVGSIKVNGTSPVKNILQPSSNTIKIIYQINGGTWRGINNKVK